MRNEFTIALVIALLMLFAVPAGTAYAGSKEDHMSRGFCARVSSGEKVNMKKCTEAEAKAKKKLKGIRIDSRDEKLCRGVSGGSYFLLEKCIANVTSPEAKKKRKELEKVLEKKKRMREDRKGIRR